MKARFKKYTLDFKTPGGTSRGVLTQKDTWFLCLEDKEQWGIGECNMFRGLSADDRPDFEEKLDWLCRNIDGDPDFLMNELIEYPSLQFGLEQALLSLKAPEPMLLLPSAFTEGIQTIAINGLIWMGKPEYMRAQIADKLQSGFRCIKVKIGALDFKTEIGLLTALREMGGPELEIRVDANGAFTAKEAPRKLEALATLNIHSIEQPIRPGQAPAMHQLCKESALPIALDEELIGIFNEEQKQELLETIQPQYIILKPSLLGGFEKCRTWINRAKGLGIDYWITSALESNIGLNAIAQWTAGLGISMPQGLGTGSLFSNNITSPLMVHGSSLQYDRTKPWDLQAVSKLCT